MIWCLHGAVGMAEDWDRLAELWSGRGHEVRRVDLWEYLTDQMSLREFGTVLNKEARDTNNNVLIGYSMGGRLALHALLSHPRVWDKAVIVSAHPGLSSEEKRMMRMAHDAEWAAMALTGDWEHFLQRWEEQSVLCAGPSRTEHDGRGERRGLERYKKQVARSFINWSLGKQDDLRSRLSEVTCPIQWVTGAQDETFSLLGQECAELLPQGAHIVIEGVGHRVPWEAPEEFGRQVIEFIS